ncbi:MAG: diguanylate cyclase [Deltaproteobacteria bacterium]|nr:diguanylate cyclase [Deltaproteobacteria bacterium]
MKAIAQVLENNRTYIYKCHANQYIFAVPVVLGPDTAYVILGGHSYLAGDEDKEFRNGLSRFALDGRVVARLREEIKTIPPKSVFTVPGIVNNLAVPFLKSLYRGEGAGRASLQAAGDGLQKGFHALEQVYKSIAPILNREDLYEAILMRSTELVGAERGSLMILDNDSNVLSVKAAKGIDRSLVGSVKIRMGEGISGGAAARGRPVMVKDIEAEVPAYKKSPRYKTKSCISIPLKLEDRVIGVINISDKISGEVFSEEDLMLMLSFSSYASIALERGAYYSMSEELKLLSMTDPLTGLYNRRYFCERIFEEVERVKRHGGHFTAFMLDIDDFKSFNDRHGHLAGDEILKKVSHAIRDAVRSMDVVARYGGEEFAAILPHTTKKDAFVIAERLRKSVAEHKKASGAAGWPTVSIGIAEYPLDASGIDDLINKADMAMYIAKRMGKNRVILYE